MLLPVRPNFRIDEVVQKPWNITVGRPKVRPEKTIKKGQHQQGVQYGKENHRLKKQRREMIKINSVKIKIKS